MSAAAVLAREISEPLTWAEICARYPDEWVCIVEMDQLHPNGFAFRTARVVGHGKTRRAPVDQAMAWRDSYELILAVGCAGRRDPCSPDGRAASARIERLHRAPIRQPSPDAVGSWIMSENAAADSVSGTPHRSVIT